MAEKLVPQTGNTPPTPLAPGAPSLEIALNPNETTSLQLFTDAAHRNRVGMEGLAWQQGSNHYVVTAHDLVHESRFQRVGDGSIAHREGGGFRWGEREVPQEVPVDIPKWTIEEYNLNGELVNTSVCNIDELAARIDDPTGSGHPGSHGPVTRAWWQEAPPKAPADLDLAELNIIDFPFDPQVVAKNAFDYIALHREEINVPGEDWIGLTWTDQDQQHRLQIVNHTIKRINTPEGTKLVTTYVAKKYDYDKHGRITIVGFETFDDNQLKDYFNGVDLFNGSGEKEGVKSFREPAKVADLHWEIPKQPRDRRIKTWAGQVAMRTGAGLPEQPLRERETADVEASLELLSSADIFSEATALKNKETLLADPLGRKIVATLAQAIVEYGAEGIRDLAAAMRDSYLEAIDKLGLPPPAQDKFSISWILHDMALQRYFAEHPEEASDTFIDIYGSGSQPPFGKSIHPNGLLDPFGTDADAMDKRRQMIDREVAVKFASTVLVAENQQRAKLDEAGEIELDDDNRPIPEMVKVYNLEPAAVKRLQHLVKKDVVRILEKVTNGEVEGPNRLGPGDLNMLGRLVRRQILQ